MQFVADNYIWFIVGGVVILMAIIGYFADRTDFGRKEFQKRLKEPKEKNTKKENTKKEKVEDVVSEVPIKIPDDASVDDVVSEEKDNLVTEDLFQTLPTETTYEDISVNNDLYQPLQNSEQVNEDLYQPLQSSEQANEDLYQPLQSSEQVTEDLYAPLQNSEQVNEDLYQPLQSSEQVSNDLFSPLENTNSTDDTTQFDNTNNPVDSEEDIWKF